MANTTHVTSGGENWSFLANKYYGDPYDIDTLEQANKNVALDPILKAGIVLIIPIKDAPLTSVDPSLLPFWMQYNG
jgi:hypothetical protein